MVTGIRHAAFLTGNLVKARAFYEGMPGLCRDPDGNSLEFVKAAAA